MESNLPTPGGEPGRPQGPASRQGPPPGRPQGPHRQGGLPPGRPPAAVIGVNAVAHSGLKGFSMGLYLQSSWGLRLESNLPTPGGEPGRPRPQGPPARAASRQPPARGLRQGGLRGLPRGPPARGSTGAATGPRPVNCCTCGGPICGTRGRHPGPPQVQRLGPGPPVAALVVPWRMRSRRKESQRITKNRKESQRITKNLKESQRIAKNP